VITLLNAKKSKSMSSHSLSSSMESCNWVLKYVSILLIFFPSLHFSTSETLTPSLVDRVITDTKVLHRNFTAISEFRTINRKFLGNCSSSNPFFSVKITPNSSLSDDGFVTVTVTGVSKPSDSDWVAMISPSNSE